jgi:hypothetical protein
MMETYRIHRYRDYWLVRNYRTGEEKFFRERYEAATLDSYHKDIVDSHQEEVQLLLTHQRLKKQ